MTKQKLLLFLLLLMGMVQGAMAQEPYAVLSEHGQTVTFYYDTQKASRSGVVEINNKWVNTNAYGTATTAVFDASFADYRPTSTAYWFIGCDAMTSITGMENLKTDNVTDMRDMFDSCSSLMSLDVSHFNTANVENMYCMFWSCSKLTTLDLSNFNTANVEYMCSMFSGCNSLTSLDVSHFNTSNVTDMSYMFSCCSSLTSLDVSSFITDNVTDMSRMFVFCSALTSLDVSNFNTANVTSMSEMFWSCSKLTTLDLSNFNTANVTDMSCMFNICSSLTTIYADEEKWSTDKVIKGYLMFNDCTNLKGGNGTAYDASHTDCEYARIDKAGQPGYLTQKGATNIENLSTAPIQEDGAWYTLGGRRVETPTKGINVKNGRKVVVK